MHAWFHWYRKYTIPNPCPWRVSLQSRQDLLWQLSVETFMNHEGYTSTKSSKTDKYTWCCRLVSAIITQISQEWYTLPSERTYLQETYHQDSLYFVPYTLENFVNISSIWPQTKIQRIRISLGTSPGLQLNDVLLQPQCWCGMATTRRREHVSWEIRMGTSSKILQ